MGPLRSSLKTFVGSGVRGFGGRVGSGRVGSCSDFDNPITKLPIFLRKSERVGSVRFGSVRFSSVRFGSVRFGSCHFQIT